MKTLLGISLVAFALCADAPAQQRNDPQNRPDVRARIESLIKSQSQQPVPTNDDKIEVELTRRPRIITIGSSFPYSISTVVIEGAVFTVIGDMPIPMPGGGASGCFDPNGAATAAKLERARAEWAKLSKKD
jgi:hypothetical protein